MTEAAPVGPAADGPWLRFRVAGMHCASCVARVEKALLAQPGVSAATVSLAREEARVRAPSAEASGTASALTDALRAEGFSLTLMSEESPAEDPSRRHAADAARLRRSVAVAAALSAPLMVLGMSGLDATWSRWLQWALATPVVLVLGAPFHRAAAVRGRRGSADMNTLISLGTLAAYTASLTALFRGGALFFESAAVIVTLILLGRSFEARAKGRASEAVARLAALGAREAIRLRDGCAQAVPVDALERGDRLRIGPGERVPTDAVVVEGRSAVDESMLTGESVPVDKAPGDRLYGATVNQGGQLIADVTGVGRDTALAQIVRAVEDAQASKAPVEQLADRVAGIFVPVVLSIAALTLAGWLTSGAAFETALENAIAVLVIACPCALGLATPTAVMVGSGRGAELGILFKRAEIFERARRIDWVVFDKTGTLTHGDMELAEWVACDGDADRFLRRVAAVEDASGHPVGAAVARGARARGLDLPPVSQLEVIPGRGVRGRVEADVVHVGRAGWLRDEGLRSSDVATAAAESFAEQGRTAFLAGWGGEVRGALAVSDRVRASASGAVAALRRAGLRIAMLSGDSEAAVRGVARATGVDEVFAGARPEQKAQRVAEFQRQGSRVAFVGDGINDAPALVQADLGIAVGGGTEIAIESGDIVLLSGDPQGVVTALALARRTFRTIGQNLFWAFAYNCAAIPLAAAGALDPMLAAGAMAFSSVTVVTNSLRLRRFGR